VDTSKTNQRFPILTSRLRRCLLGLLACGLVLPVVCGVSNAAEDTSQDPKLYFKGPFYPEGHVQWCIQFQAKIQVFYGGDDPGTFFGAALKEGITVEDAKEFLSRLPNTQEASERIVTAIQEEIDRRYQGRANDPGCLKVIDFEKHSLLVVTLALESHYECDKLGCTLPITVAYTVCHKLECRAGRGGPVGRVDSRLHQETFAIASTNLQGYASRIVSLAGSNLR
jgi:hypothetical protein